MTDFDKLIRILAKQPSCGLGCVILPPDVEKQTYINRCFSTETVSMVAQAGGMSFNNVPVSVDALQQVEFPEKPGEFGSVVVFLLHPKTAQPIIIAVLSKKSELYGVNWKQFKRFKKYKNNYVSVVGDGKNGTLFVNVQGDEGSKGGQIMISIGEPSNKGKLKVSVQGDINFINQNFSMDCLTTKIVSQESFDVETKSYEVTSETVKLNASEKVSLGEGDYEPLVLGETLLKEIFKPLLSALKTDLQVTTSMGPSGPPLPPFVAKILALEQKLNLILSKKSETE